MIPFVDLKAQYRAIAAEIDAAIASVIADTAFIGGKYRDHFEASFAEYCHARHCVGVGNGTDALFLVLKVAGIGRGDEVIVPANSFIATAEPVTLAGARVVFADIDPETYNLDVADVETKLTPKTRAVIAVHLYGQPASLTALAELCRRSGALLIQDCAQAHGATLAGKPLIDYGGALCYSFYPGKNLGAYGDAGAIVTGDDELARACRMIANHGRCAKYDHELEGVNSRLDGLQAAILSVKLRHLEAWTKRRRAIAALYDRLLEDVAEVTTPRVAAGARHVYHLYVIRTRERDALGRHLEERGVRTGIHYPVALPNLKAYRYLEHRPEDFPVASRNQDEVLSLPMYAELTDDMAVQVASEIRSFFGRAS